MLDKGIEKAILTTQKELKDLNVDLNLDILREIVKCAFDDAREKLTSLKYDTVHMHRFASWKMRDKYAYERDNGVVLDSLKPGFSELLEDLKSRQEAMKRECGNCVKVDEELIKRKNRFKK